MLLKEIHQAFGGGLRALLVGGAFTEPATIAFFHDLGIPIYNGYGSTEACTAISINDLKPFRPDTLGKPVRGMEIRILNPSEGGIGEVAVRSKTVMSHYLDDPQMTAETIVDGWLMTGDLGSVDKSGHLRLFGRKKNMIVTEEGKNIYPEDIETVFEDLPVKEFCVFAANYLWPARTMVGEQLVLVVHPRDGQSITPEIVATDFGAQSPPAELQTHQRLSCLGARLSSHRVDENQACRARWPNPRSAGARSSGFPVTSQARIFHRRESRGWRRAMRASRSRRA